MKMKIGVVNVACLPMLEQWGYLQLQEQNLRRVLGDDVELVFEGSNNSVEETSIELLFNPFFTSLDGRVLLEKLYKLQEEACDGVIISCSLDPVLAEARSLLSIPIVGALEASILTACTAGPKFGFLIPGDRRCKEMTGDVVEKYGLLGRMSPMVDASDRYEELTLAAFKNPELVREEIMTGCKEVIERGAHSVILASTSLANLATANGISQVPEYGAPIFDPICIGAKMLAYKIDLQRSMQIPQTSRAGVLQPFPKQFAKDVMSSFGFAA